MAVGQLQIHRQRSTPHIKINSKWNKDLNAKAGIKFLEVGVFLTLDNIDMTPKAQAT